MRLDGIGMKLGYSRKKGEEGLRIWNFQGYWRKSKCIFQGLIKNNVKFLGVFKKESCETSITVFLLGLRIYDGSNTCLWSS